MSITSKKPPLTRDEYIELRIERAMAKHGPLRPDLDEEIRRGLRLLYAVHPEMSMLISRLRPREDVAESEERSTNGELAKKEKLQ
jgi:hypothetical protein